MLLNSLPHIRLMKSLHFRFSLNKFTAGWLSSEAPGHDGLGQAGGRRAGRLQERHRASRGQLQAVPEVRPVPWLANEVSDVID